VKNDANAIFYIKHTGQAYFGGALNPGIIKNEVQSTDLSSTASATLGPFTTLGSPKEVRVEYTVGTNAFQNGSDASGVSGTATLILERSLNGGSTWTQIGGTLNVTSNTVCTINEPEIGGWTCTRGASDSLLTTDTNTSTSDFMYRARLTSRSLTYSPTTQVIRLQSVES
jgi:hypothetical protein